ncbi:MAG: GHKL domain-containing protein [Lachnospiraceae bacterium]
MILSLVNNIFLVFMLHMYNSVLYGINKNRKKYLLLGWSIVVLIYIVQKNISSNIPILNILLCFAPYFLITYVFYNVIWKNLLIYTAFYCVSTIIAELICYVILSIFIHSGNVADFSYLLETLSNLLVIIGLRFFILFVTKEKYEIKFTDFIGVLLIPVGSIILILQFCNPLQPGNYPKDILAIVILFAFNVFSYYFYIRMQENIKLEYRTTFLEKKNQDYVQESKKVAELWEKISLFQHDMKYYSELEKNRWNDFAEISGFKNIVSQSGCAMIDAIINSKASYAEQLGINFQADIHIALDMDYCLDDLSIILYNAIDNAIEANINNNINKYIKIKIDTDLRNEKTLLIHIMNPYEKIIKKNHKGEYVTNKEDKRAHGYGLKSIKQLVEKHKGEMKIDDDNNIFSLNIILFDVGKERKLQK